MSADLNAGLLETLNDPEEPPAGRVAAAAVVAAMRVATELGLSLTDVVVMTRVEEGEQRNSVVAWPPDPQRMVHHLWGGLQFSLQQLGMGLDIDLRGFRRKHVRPVSSPGVPRSRPSGRGMRRGR